MKGAVIEKQIQQVLLYIQEESADIQKKNILEDLKSREVKFESIREFLLELKKEFGEEDENSVKVVELKEQNKKEELQKNLCKSLEEQLKETNMKKEHQQRNLKEE